MTQPEPDSALTDDEAQRALDARPDILTAIERLHEDPAYGVLSGRPKRRA